MQKQRLAMDEASQESGLFSDLDLARRLERAEARASAGFVEARASVFPQSGAQWIQVAGAYAMYDGVSSPVTQTFGLGLFEPATGAVLDQLESFFQDRGAPVCHEVSPLAGLPLLALLNERGYVPIELTSVMYRSLRPDLELPKPRRPGIGTRLVGEQEQQLWAETAAKGWSLELPELSDFLLDQAIPAFGGVQIEGERQAPPAALLGAGAIPLVGQEVLHTGQEKPAKPPSFTLDLVQSVFLQKPDEEGLRQVLSLIRVVPLPADKGIKAVPVGAAQRLQGPPGFSRRVPAGRQHNTPMRGREARSSRHTKILPRGRRYPVIIRTQTRAGNRPGLCSVTFPRDL